MDQPLTARCACGWETNGTEDEVVDATREHGARLHNMAATRGQVLALATPANAPTAVPDRQMGGRGRPRPRGGYAGSAMGERGLSSSTHAHVVPTRHEAGIAGRGGQPRTATRCRSTSGSRSASRSPSGRRVRPSSRPEGACGTNRCVAPTAVTTPRSRRPGCRSQLRRGRPEVHRNLERLPQVPRTVERQRVHQLGRRNERDKVGVDRAGQRRRAPDRPAGRGAPVDEDQHALGDERQARRG